MRTRVKLPSQKSLLKTSTPASFTAAWVKPSHSAGGAPSARSGRVSGASAEKTRASGKPAESPSRITGGPDAA
jgi:hypothetical protein